MIEAIMAETPFSDEDSGPSIKSFGTPEDSNQNHPDFEDNLVPCAEDFGAPHTNGDKANGGSNHENYSEEIEQEISESLDHLSTNHGESGNSGDSDSSEEPRKCVRVGNHYQARIPKYLNEFRDYSTNDELLWDPLVLETQDVEAFLNKISTLNNLLIPMGNHLRDDEEALYMLQQNNHNVEKTFDILKTNSSSMSNKMSAWSEVECRNFENGLLTFGKNFFRIQKYKVNSRSIGELVQFYYLWKKTERYDIFASRIRSGKKKYLLNPGISDLMCRYIGGQITPDVQYVVTENKKDVTSNNSQY